jgi:hypothetical protein
MESPDELVVEPHWVSALLDATDRFDLPEKDQNGPTVRGEFVRRVRRSDLGRDQEAVVRAGIAALDGELRTS